MKANRKLILNRKLDQVLFSSIVTRHGFYQKVRNNIRKQLHKRIFKHPHFICYPDKRDTTNDVSFS